MFIKPPKPQSKYKPIIDHFKMVCQGIRNEYENGAGHRSLAVDLNTLRSLLKSLKYSRKN